MHPLTTSSNPSSRAVAKHPRQKRQSRQRKFNLRLKCHTLATCCPLCRHNRVSCTRQSMARRQSFPRPGCAPHSRPRHLFTISPRDPRCRCRHPVSCRHRLCLNSRLKCRLTRWTRRQWTKINRFRGLSPKCQTKSILLV